jgi:hypothetical protein
VYIVRDVLTEQRYADGSKTPKQDGIAETERQGKGQLEGELVQRSAQTGIVFFSSLLLGLPAAYHTVIIVRRKPETGVGDA